MQKITKIMQSSRNSSIIQFDNGSNVEVHNDIITKFALSIGQGISDEKYSEIISENELMIAKQAAYNYATYTARTERQVVEKLKKSGFNENTIQLAIDFLKDYNLIDDEKYTASFINEKAKFKKWGINKIKIELLKKGIEKNIIDVQIRDLYNEEIDFENAIKLAERKMKAIMSKPIEKQRQTLVNFLQNKGYKWEIIMKVLQKLKFK
ncbi:MAG: recombination regulator RecX [Ignavibacteria bacterium]|nr:recombination regulator RecX [Ignavibacteria bacterium]